MDLKDTIYYMCSPDYNERFKAEYLQLEYRIKKLEFLVSAYEKDALWFEPKTPLEVLKEQLDYMRLYLEVLKSRAKFENINIKEWFYG